MSILELILLLAIARTTLSLQTPIVLWHGIGTDHLESLRETIRENIDDSIYIKSIHIGRNAIADFVSGIFVHPNDQIADVCRQIAEDEKLMNGFHAIGLSQGAQFL